MTLEAAAPLVAVSVLIWVMIVLPIVLLAGIGIAYLLGRGRTSDEIRPAPGDSPGPDDVDRRLPGA